MSKALSEELKDIKIQQILEDYIALQQEINDIPEKIKEALQRTDESIERLPEFLTNHTNQLSEAFREVIDSSGEQLIQRVNHIVEACQEVEKEINSSVEYGKTEVSKHILGLMSAVKSDFSEMTDTYQKNLNNMIKQNKPFSFSKAIAVCALSVVLISSAICGGVIYGMNEHFDSRINFYGSAYHDLHEAAQKSARFLPKNEQEELRQKIKNIDARSM